MQGSLRRSIFALALALAGAGALGQTATAPDDPAGGKPAAGAPPGFVVPADPKPGDTEAERTRSQPGNNAPVWRAARDSGNHPGVTTLPNNEGATLIQRFVQYPGSAFTTAGEAWRQTRNNWIVPAGAALIVFALVVLALFYASRGSIGGNYQDRPKPIERFTYFERATHWTVAITFVVLALSGIVMAFGKYFLLPVLGATLFGWLTYALKTLHNMVGPLFALAVLVLIVSYVRDNIPRAYDLTWLAKGGGGMFGFGAHVASHKFNAGEKIVFWGGVLVLGLVVSGSGFFLDKLVPGMTYTRGQMQIGHIVHAVASMLMMALFLGHIYLGTIGMKGAYQAMKTGRVSDEWAKEHHGLWYEDIKAGKIPAQRSAQPAGGMRAAKEGA